MVYYNHKEQTNRPKAGKENNVKKAKLIGKIYDRYGKFVDLEYEYRGKTYFVRNHFSGNAMDEQLWMQHNEAQKAIDNELDSPMVDRNHTWRYEGSADEALDLFLNFFN